MLVGFESESSSRRVTECSAPPHQVRLIWCTGWSLDLLSVQVLCAGSQSPGEIQELAAGTRAEAGPMSYSHLLVSFLFYLFFINYKAILSLLSNAVLVSAVQKCESAICIHISPFSQTSSGIPPHRGLQRTLSRTPCIIQQFPTSYLFVSLFVLNKMEKQSRRNKMFCEDVELAGC